MGEREGGGGGGELCSFAWIMAAPTFIEMYIFLELAHMVLFLYYSMNNN